MEAYYNIGCEYGQLGRDPEAIVAYKQAISLKPDYAEAHSNLGSALANLGRLDEAIAQFNEALRIDPALDDVRKNLEAARDLQRESGGKE